MAIAWIYLALTAVVVVMRPSTVTWLFRTAREVAAEHGGSSG
jgi:hypothetical protein